MTEDEFFNILGSLNRKWFIDREDDGIRCNSDYGIECPITAVYNSIHPNKTFSAEWASTSARRMSLPKKLAADIIHASDIDEIATYNMRQKLLKILKLEENYDTSE